MSADVSQIGPYRIEALIGEGAASKVYRAVDEHGAHVALKLLDRPSASDDRFRRRFVRESELAAGVEHPNVVRPLDAGEADGQLYLAMELVEGTNLRSVLRTSWRLEPEQAVGVIEQVARGLDAAHASGLVHRDVKPGNILIADDTALICDFGLARHVSSANSLTGDRGFVGTIDYVPPEQIEGIKVDARADVYALGCVLYECLTGGRPFDRESELGVVFAHLNDPPPKPTDMRPELPAAFDDVVATALAKSPEFRYGSCGELASAARSALRGKVVGRRRSRRRLLVLAGALVLATTAGVAGALVGTRGDDGRLATITPTSIAGARLGDSNYLIRQLWGGGQKFLAQTPQNYLVVTKRTRNLGAYFVGTSDKVVELTTWNRADRTAEGIGPCSTVAELKRAYGKRLKASPYNTHGKDVSGWTVGKHLFFAMSFPKPDRVSTVAIYSNDLPSAGYIALNDGPCSLAANSAPVRRPNVIPQAREPALPRRFVSQAFDPGVTVRVPRRWRIVKDTRDSFRIASPGGTTIEFRLDPLASSPAGDVLPDVSTTSTSLAAWLQQDEALKVTPPQNLYIGRQVFQTLFLGVESRGRRVPYFVFSGSAPVAAAPGHHARVYLTPVRMNAWTHTLAVIANSPSPAAFDEALPTVAAIVKDLVVAGAPAGILTAFSSLCTEAWQGTCLGELKPGTYSTRSMSPKLTYTVPLGWTNSGDKIGFFGLIPPGGDFTAVDLGKSDRINVFSRITTGNGRCADGHGTARTPEQIVAWFRTQPGFATIRPRRASVGGLSGYVVDLRMRLDFRATCPWSQGFPAQQAIAGLPPSPEQMNHSAYPGHYVMRLYLLRYHNGTLGIEIDDARDDALLAAYDKVVHTFTFAQD